MKTLDTIPTNCIEVNYLTNLYTLLRDKEGKFKCPGCGEIVEKFDGWKHGMVCDDCEGNAPDCEGAGYYDDSWGDHNPNYDY